MKQFQIKPLIFSTALLIIVVGIRLHQSHRLAQRWKQELAKITHVESVEEHKRYSVSVAAVDSTVNSFVVKKKHQKSKSKLTSNEKKHDVKRKNSTYQNKTIEKVNINTDEVEAWKQLPGIGEVLSVRIVKFKDRLGGFHSVGQLKEVYGLSEETYALILPHLFNSLSIQLIDLKTIEFKNLLRHPYFEYEDVKSVKNYVRKKPIQSKQDLVEASKKDAGWVDKVWPYLKQSKIKEHSIVVAGLSK